MIQLAVNTEQWIQLIQEYADVQELDSGMLNCLVRKIVVHEHIDSNQTRNISIEIHFNLKTIPEVKELTTHNSR